MRCALPTAAMWQEWRELPGCAITGTSVNPARSLGPALMVGATALAQLWLFILAPLIGGAVAGLVVRLRVVQTDQA